ncbi:MAG: ACT domain-containing protein [Clostridia bacterium]|jgi:ACT domain-containing protein|nr:ACT domain-containing protein [Clostridia bacterium]
MNAIVTVIGQNRVGIIAAISTRLAALGVDILDVSQTILNGSFTMVMVVNLEGASASFVEIRDALSDLAAERGLSIRIQRQEIFEAMHTV